MALKTASTGAFLIPTAPAVGTTVTGGTANTFTTNAVQLIASTAAAIFITGIHVNLSSTSKPTYVVIRLSTGASDGTIVGEYVIPYASTSGATGTILAGYIPIWPWIAVATATRIGCKSADSVGSLGHTVILSCINQANVVDAAIAEIGDVTKWNGTAVATPNTAGVPVVDSRLVGRVGTAQGTGNSTTAIKLDAGASATTDFYKYQRITVISGTGSPQSAICTAYDGSTKIATVTPAWPTAPDNTSVFVVSMDAQSDVASFAGSAASLSGAYPQVNLGSIGGSSAYVNAFQFLLQGIVRGTTSSGCTTTSLTTSSVTGIVTLDSGTVTDEFKGCQVQFAANTTTKGLRCATAVITGSTSGATPTLTVTPALPATPGSGETFTILPAMTDTEVWRGDAVLTPALTGVPKVDVNAIQADTGAGLNFYQSVRSVINVSLTTGATTTSLPTNSISTNNAALTGIVADQFKGCRVRFFGTTTTAGLRGATAIITANTASNTPTITVTPDLPATPASGDQYVIESATVDVEAWKAQALANNTITGAPSVDVAYVFGEFNSAAALSYSMHAGPHRGTCTNTSTTTSVVTSALSQRNTAASGVVASQFVGSRVRFYTDTTTAGLRGATAIITASTASNTPTLTVTPALPATPTTGDLFVIETANSDLQSVRATAQTARDLGGQLDAAISTRLATAGYTAPLDAAGTRAAVGLASANLDTQLATIAGYIDTEVAAILAAVDTEVAAIKAKTDLIPGTQDGKTYAEITLLMASVLLGKASGLDTTTAVYRALDDSKDRVTATVTTDGNRSAVTLDAT